jgi:uncharacterized protein (TIGR02757 family)
MGTHARVRRAPVPRPGSMPRSAHAPLPDDDALRAELEALYAATDGARRRAGDPVAFVHRYAGGDVRDVEAAGLVAVSLAYGRVSLFFPVLEALFAWMDGLGGPAAAARQATPATAAPILPLVYRWNRGSHLGLLLAAVGRLQARHGSLEALLARPAGAGGVGPSPLRPRLTRLVEALRGEVRALAPDWGLAAEPDAPWETLPRGLRALLPSPADGSACKRLNLWLRWMVRPPCEDVDLGVWTRHVRPDELVMPVDVHVGRIARLVGLTERQDASWRTAEAIAARLARWDPADPVRFDFALAHLGISEGCSGVKGVAACASCPLRAVCRAPDRAQPDSATSADPSPASGAPERPSARGRGRAAGPTSRRRP